MCCMFNCNKGCFRKINRNEDLFYFKCSHRMGVFFMLLINFFIWHFTSQSLHTFHPVIDLLLHLLCKPTKKLVIFTISEILITSPFTLQIMNTYLAETELILNKNGSVYHLKLLPEQVCENIIVVGDPGRVKTVSSFFDIVDLKIHNREFVTHGGTYRGKRVMAVSSGIGTDNIDILMNELDAAVNIDLTTRRVKEKHTALNIVRLGTSGALQAAIPVNGLVITEYALGFDGLLNYYADLHTINETDLSAAFIQHSKWSTALPFPYAVKGSEHLFQKLGEDCIPGITATAPGFYAPQGRSLRLKPWTHDFNRQLTDFRYADKCITNFEMETSALYGLGKLLGHHACAICVIIANRITKTYSSNFASSMNGLIEVTLQRLTK
ncbi:MAG TPA: nucleoside phosphorylase, partial [Chitinophagales bacterium]|nr:nucleoside phosphorylase [Chitinophagales bacterium]